MSTRRAGTVIIAVGLVALFLPTVVWLVQAWVSSTYYSHGPLVILGAGYFAWVGWRGTTRSSVTAPVSRTDRWIGWALAALGVITHVLALPWRAYWISALAFPFVACGVLVALRGMRFARVFAFPLLFLLAAIPLPIVEQIGPPLQSFATTASVGVARLAGIDASSIGSQITLPGLAGAFIVGIPCGGLNSLVALLTMTAVAMYVFKGPAVSHMVLFLIAIPIALAANVTRLVLLFLIAVKWGADAGMRYFHDWSSIVLFIVALGILLLAARLLKCDTVAWEHLAP